MGKSNPKILVEMSGGVDSSVAAAMLMEKGYEVTGVTMKIWDGEVQSSKGKHHGCYGPEEEADVEDARQVAQLLGIPFQVLDLTQEYKSVVLDYFSEEYLQGRTPNPCVRCNQRIKFSALIQKATDLGLKFDYIASGHYARIEYNAESDRYLLRKAKDVSKDQSYFLALLSQEQLRRLWFPLGDYLKTEVRKRAIHFGLQVAEKPDSQNFISGDYTSMIKVPSIPGPVLDKKGNVLGQHPGIHNYTIGQRKGLGLATRNIMYVTSLDSQKNAVIVGNRDEMFSKECVVSNLNWISISDLNQPLVVKAKIRSSHKEGEATLIPQDKGIIKVKFSEPQMAITPGQVAVFYDGEIVVGGGIINEV